MRDQAYNLRQRMKLQEKQSKTIAIFSGKGGVGKSNFALNFSMELIEKGNKVLIFDLDIGMGNIDILLGLQSRKSIMTMLEKKLQISDIIEVGPNNLSYVAAGTGLSDFFHLDEQGHTYFMEQLQSIINSYDYIIFDLGAGMNEEHLAFIEAADESIVVTTPEPTSITDAYAAIKRVIVHTQRQKLKLSLMVNRVSNQEEGQFTYNKLHAVVSKFLQHELHLFGMLPEDSNIREAVKEQKPFTLFNKKTKASKAIKKLVENYPSVETDFNKSEHKFVDRLKSIFTRKVD
ncbi:MinD/ParA family protein [Alkalibacillus silvisoli]|uniref:Flagellum location/number ATPase FlhG n=1 Tax=Alkalibacillus silvisoli TaxID=392823 RepID=A0ABN0ZWK7_9BACI